METKRTFVVIAHDSPVRGDFSLKDLPGAGRVDELARCITSALLISNDIRKDTSIILVLQKGNESKVVRFDGERMKHLNPDERTTAILLQKALKEEIFIFEKEVLTGITLVPGDGKDLLEKLREMSSIIHLIEGGRDAFERSVMDEILGYCQWCEARQNVEAFRVTPRKGWMCRKYIKIHSLTMFAESQPGGTYSAESIERNGEIVIVLSDRKDLSQDEKEFVKEISDLSISLGPLSLQSHQAITIMNNLLDREFF